MKLEELSKLNFDRENIAAHYASTNVSHEAFGITNAFSEIAAGFNKLFRDKAITPFTLGGTNVASFEYEDYCFMEIKLPVGIRTKNFETSIVTIIEISRLVKTHEDALIDGYKLIIESMENSEVMDKMVSMTKSIKIFTDNAQAKLELVIDPKSREQVVKIKDVVDSHAEFMHVLDLMNKVHFEARAFKDVGYMSYDLDEKVEEFKEDVRNNKVVPSELFIDNLQDAIGTLAKATTIIFKIRALSKILNDVRTDIFRKLDKREDRDVSTESTGNMDIGNLQKFRTSAPQRLLKLRIEPEEITVKDFVKLANDAHEFLNGVEVSSRGYYKRIKLYGEGPYKRAVSMLENKYVNYTEVSTKAHIKQFDILCKEIYGDLTKGSVSNKAIEELPEKETGHRRLVIEEFGYKSVVDINEIEIESLSKTLTELNGLAEQFVSSIDQIVVERIPLKDKPEYTDLYNIVLKLRLAHFIFHTYIKPFDLLTVEIGYLLERFQ